MRSKRVSEPEAEMQKKNRDGLDIAAEILTVAMEGVIKTHIMYRAGLSFAQLKKYLDLLTNPDITLEMIVGYNPILKTEKRKKRGKHAITVEILKLAKKGVNKTKIMYEGKLSFFQLKKYLGSLQKSGHLKKDKKTYKTTDKGLAYLDNIQGVENILLASTSEPLLKGGEEGRKFKTTGPGLELIKIYGKLEGNSGSLTPYVHV